ncbi:hypothetical protein ACMA1I_14985 [Pontibacter sp. 13R65]
MVYTWRRERIKHLAIDHSKLETYPMENGRWPGNRIPLIRSVAQ